MEVKKQLVEKLTAAGLNNMAEVQRKNVEKKPKKRELKKEHAEDVEQKREAGDYFREKLRNIKFLINNIN